MVQDAKDWSEIMRIIMIILLYGQPQFLTVKKINLLYIQFCGEMFHWEMFLRLQHLILL